MPYFEIENGILKKYNGTESEVTVPEGVNEIGVGAFGMNNTLTSLYIPEGVKVIHDSACIFCENLEYLHLPDSLEIIENGAFRRCAVRNLVIPKNVFVVEPFAFRECDNLETVTILPDKIIILPKAFNREHNFVVRARPGTEGEEYAKNWNTVFEPLHD